MSGDQDERAELSRRFQAVIDAAGLDELRDLTSSLLSLGGREDRPAERERRIELRRPPLGELKLFRVRVVLQRSRPPIWRRLDVRSDLRLDALHQVLQAAFSWDDYHLWRFCLGGDPFDRSSQLFLCPWDVEEGELEDEGGLPADQVRLDECMQDPGDVLGYVYDYGDHWQLSAQLEGVTPAEDGAPSAVCVGGRRAAPPEDCGSLRDAEELAGVLEDPSRFELDEINRALRAPYFALREAGLNPAFVDLVNRLAYSTVGEDLTARAATLIGQPQRPNDAELCASLRAFTWFLDRAEHAGIPLTAAGYLKPEDVQAAARVIPTMYDWIGKAKRELDTTPVLIFRELLQELGLLRKYKGTLRLTKTGTAARASAQSLWSTIARKLIATDSGFEEPATILILAYAATSAEAEIPLEPIAAALSHLGWRTSDGEPIAAYHLYHLRALRILQNIATEQSSWRDRQKLSRAAAALAHESLRWVGSNPPKRRLAGARNAPHAPARNGRRA